jgi:hypothetical protein
MEAHWQSKYQYISVTNVAYAVKIQLDDTPEDGLERSKHIGFVFI